MSSNIHNSKLEENAKQTKWLAGGSFFSGLLAFLGASCCVLPILLVQLGVSSALVGRLALFARYRSWLLSVSAIAVLLAIGFAFRKGRRPGKALWFWLILATLLVVSAYFLPHYEGQILRWMQAR